MSIYNYIPYCYSDDNSDTNPANVYINPTELSGIIVSHALRPIVKITNIYSGKSILRYVSGKSMNGLNKSSITMDILNARELKIITGDQIIVSKANIFERTVIFPFRHPDEAIRLAFNYFIISVIISFFTLLF
jgi:hypothetical protein